MQSHCKMILQNLIALTQINMNMKSIKTLLLAVFAFTTLSVAAQTADEIIAKNTEAMGGAAKISALVSVKKKWKPECSGNGYSNRDDKCTFKRDES